DPVPITDAHLVICQAFHGEVLPELAIAEVGAAKLLLPVPVGLDLVYEHRPVLPAMPCQIALPVPVDVQPPDEPRPLDGPLPHRGVHDLAVPGHILRQAHIHREQPANTPVHDHQLRPSRLHAGWPSGPQALRPSSPSNRTSSGASGPTSIRVPNRLDPVTRSAFADWQRS